MRNSNSITRNDRFIQKKATLPDKHLQLSNSYKSARTLSFFTIHHIFCMFHLFIWKQIKHLTLCVCMCVCVGGGGDCQVY